MSTDREIDLTFFWNFCENFLKIVNQQRNVVFSFAQRRQTNLNDIYAKQQILTKFTFFDHGFEIGQHPLVLLGRRLESSVGRQPDGLFDRHGIVFEAELCDTATEHVGEVEASKAAGALRRGLIGLGIEAFP